MTMGEMQHGQLRIYHAVFRPDCLSREMNSGHTRCRISADTAYIKSVYISQDAHPNLSFFFHPLKSVDLCILSSFSFCENVCKPM